MEDEAKIESTTKIDKNSKKILKTYRIYKKRLTFFEKNI